MAFTLTSAAFRHHGVIPVKYTQDGENISPPLSVHNPPKKAVTLALIVDDPDAALDPLGPGKTFVHWVLFNIPITDQIEEDKLPDGAIEGLNSTDDHGYIGPAPPTGEHNYNFTLFALDKTLNLDEDTTKEQLLDAMKDHIVATTMLVGRYQRQDRSSMQTGVEA